MKDAESRVARILIAGGMLSVAIMLCGLVAFAARGGVNGETLDLDRLLANRAQGRAAQTFVSIGSIVRGLAHRPVDPTAVIAAGVVLLLLTPVAGVVGALLVFIRENDRTYVTITAVLVVALLLSFVLAGAG